MEDSFDRMPFDAVHQYGQMRQIPLLEDKSLAEFQEEALDVGNVEENRPLPCLDQQPRNEGSDKASTASYQGRHRTIQSLPITERYPLVKPVFRANDEPFLTGLIACNLLNRIRRLGLPKALATAQLKRLGFLLLQLLAIVIRHSRQLWVKIKRDHPMRKTRRIFYN